MFSGKHGPMGQRIVITGIIKGFGEKIAGPTSKTPGKKSNTVSVAFGDGEAYLTLKDPRQLMLLTDELRDKDITVECEARSFKDSMYPGAAVIVAIDGKRIDPMNLVAFKGTYAGAA